MLKTLHLTMIFLTASAFAVPVEDFEFASSDPAAAAGVTTSPESGVTIGVASGTGANANEGTYALRINFSTTGTVGGFEGGFVQRTLPSPIVLSRGYTDGGAPGYRLTDLRLTLDIKGDPGMAPGGNQTNFWIFLHNGQGDRFRYINFTDTALSTTTYTDDHQIGLGLIDRDAGSTGPGVLDQITAVEIYIQNPQASTPKTGTLYVDDLQISEIPSQWGAGVVVDGSVDEWDGQVPAAVLDVSGDASTGRDLQAVYLANDAANLYVRLQSYNTNDYDGNELTGIDGDASALTGFNLYAGGLGSDTLIAGASAFGETTGSFNSGVASPDAVAWAPVGLTDEVEFAVPLDMTIPGNITQSFPGGLGSLIQVITGDTNVGPFEQTSVISYVLTPDPGPAAVNRLIDDMSAYDSDASADKRQNDISNPGSTALAGNRAAGGPGGGADVALEVDHTNPAGTAFIRSMTQHGFAEPRNIGVHSDITVDIFGDPALSAQNLIVGLRDADGDSFAVGSGAPVSAEWNTVSLGPTSTWFDQNPGTGDDVLDLERITAWYIGIEEQTASGSTSTIGYDNLQAVLTTTAVRREIWALYR